MNLKKITVILVMVILATTVTASIAVEPASAWCWYTFHGHAAVRSDPGDIPSNIRSYVATIEYDAMSAPKMGARLYLTKKGRIYGTHPYGAYKIAKFVKKQYWAGDRSTWSVAWEIWCHSWAIPAWRHAVHIEYFYADLSWNNPPYVW